jgi:hypothetical protein
MKLNPADEPMVTIKYGKFTECNSQKQSIEVQVVNEGKFPIDEVRVAWVYDYEAPQDATKEFTAQHGAAFTRATGQRPISVDAMGRRYWFNVMEGQKKGPLEAGESRVFLFPSAWIPDILSVVQSLSPERYHVAVILNGKEEIAIPGTVIGEFVDKEFGRLA